MSARRSRAVRVAAWTAGSLAFCALALVVASNVLLRTTWLRGEIGSRPDAMVMDWKGARSWFPGRASVESLTLRIRDSNMELQAVLEGVEVRFSLLDALRHRFHATRVRVDRVRFRLRERLTTEEATPARLARYPPIEGWPSPPLIGVPPTPPPQVDPWRIVVDDLAVEHVEEIWIDSWRWVGSGRVEGGFEVLPSRQARVGPARAQLATGTVRRGDATVAARTAGSVWCEIPSFDSRVYGGNEVWKILSGGAALRGEFGGLGFLDADEGGPRFSGGEGVARVRVALKDGAGEAAAALTAHHAKVRTKARSIRGTVVVDLVASGIDFRKGEASLAGTSVVLSDVSVADSGMVDAWAATFHTRTARLDFDPGSVDMRVEGRIRDARPIVALMPRGLPRWAAGILRLEDLVARGHVTAAPSTLSLEALEVSAGNFSLDGRYRRTRGVGRGSLHVKKGIFSVRFAI